MEGLDIWIVQFSSPSLFMHNPGSLSVTVRYAVTIRTVYVLNTSYTVQVVLSNLPALLRSELCFSGT